MRGPRQRRRITDDYPGQSPYRFTGTITRVAIDVSGAPYLDLEREASAMLAWERSPPDCPRSEYAVVTHGQQNAGKAAFGVERFVGRRAG